MVPHIDRCEGSKDPGSIRAVEITVAVVRVVVEPRVIGPWDVRLRGFRGILRGGDAATVARHHIGDGETLPCVHPRDPDAKHHVGMNDVIGEHLITAHVAFVGQVLDNADLDLRQLGLRQDPLFVDRDDGAGVKFFDPGGAGLGGGAGRGEQGKREGEQDAGDKARVFHGNLLSCVMPDEMEIIPDAGGHKRRSASAQGRQPVPAVANTVR